MKEDMTLVKTRDGQERFISNTELSSFLLTHFGSEVKHQVDDLECDEVIEEGDEYLPDIMTRLKTVKRRHWFAIAFWFTMVISLIVVTAHLLTPYLVQSQ